MQLTVSVDEKVLERAQQRAGARGTSVDELVREYVEQLAGSLTPDDAADQWEKLCRETRGNSLGWKFNRDEIHERR